MEFLIDTAQNISVSDNELYDLLYEVYVEAGYTDVSTAETLFDPKAVRQRGVIFSAREIQSSVLAGMLILVAGNSPASKFATASEMEIHLLGVRTSFSGQGLGKKLVKYGVNQAVKRDCAKIILWTQAGMQAAQSLYEGLGFQNISNKDFTKNGKAFKYYELNLNSSL